MGMGHKNDLIGEHNSFWLNNDGDWIVIRVSNGWVAHLLWCLDSDSGWAIMVIWITNIGLGNNGDLNFNSSSRSSTCIL